MSAANPSAPSSSTAAPRFERFVLIAAVLASSMAFIDATALDVALPTLQADLNVQGSDLFWISNAYALFLAALILVGGALGDLFGRKRVFVIGIAAFTVASIACGLAPTVELLIIARAAQGIGGALMVPGSLALIAATFSEAKRGKAIGTWSTFSTVTTIAGPVLGGLLASWGLWRLVFFVNVPLGIIAIYLLLQPDVPESRDETGGRRLDIVGAILITVSLALLTIGFTAAPTAAPGDPVLPVIIGGFVALIAFVVVESRIAHPMVPLKLFRSRTFTGTNLLTLFLYAALRVAPFFLALNIQQIQGYPQEIAGLTFLPLSLGLLVLSRWAGGLVDRFGAKLLLTVGPAIAGVGFFMFALPGLTNDPSDYWTTYFPAIVVLGIGLGLTVAPLTTAVMNAAPRENSGTASGINNAVARTAGVLAVAVVGGIALSVFQTELSNRAPAELPTDARAALIDSSGALGATQPPEGLDESLTASTQTAIRESFVTVFNGVAVVSALLAWIAALFGFLLVEGKEAKPKGVSNPAPQTA